MAEDDKKTNNILDEENKNAKTESELSKDASFQLKKTQQLLLEIAKIGKVGGWEIDANTKVQTWTEETYSIHEVDASFKPTLENGLNFYTPASKPLMEEAVRLCIKEGKPFNLDLQIITAKNNIHDVLIIGQAELEKQRVYGFFQDITERKTLEKKLEEIDRALKATGSSNQILIHATDEKKLLKDICQAIVNVGYRMAWVGYKENDEGKTFKPVASAGYEEGYLSTLNITWDDTERGQGPMGKTLRTGTWHVVKNIFTDPDYAPMRDEAMKHGYASIISLPINTDGTMACLNIYSDTTDVFKDEEIKILTEFSEDLTFGIKALRAEQERKKIAEDLRESEKRFKDIFDYSSVGVSLVALDGKWMEVNDSLCRITGYSRGELLGSKFNDITHPDDKEKSLETLQKLFSGETERAFLEKRYMGKNGKMIWVDVNISLVRDKNNSSPLYFIVVTEDITPRKNIEKALEKSEIHFRQTLDVMIEGCMIINFDWKYLYVNDTAARHGQNTRENLIGKTMIEMYPGIEKTSVFAHYKRCMEERAPEGFEDSYTFTDGVTRWYRFSLEPVQEGIFVLSIDITARKKTEDELKESRELLSLFILESPIYAYIKAVTPVENHVLYASRNFLELTGNERNSDITGKTMEELFPAEFAKKITEDDREVVSLGKILRLDEKLNGREYSTVKFPIHFGGKNLLAGYSIDVTENKKSMEQLIESKKETDKMNKIMLNRETRVVELKEEIKKLKEELPEK